MTPHEAHKALGHKMTRHNPDGWSIIEECTECGGRWHHSPDIGYPVTMDRRTQSVELPAVDSNRE